MGLRTIVNGDAGAAGVITVGWSTDHIRTAAAAGRYWTVSPLAPDQWILHQFDERTGTFTDPVATSTARDVDDDGDINLAWTLRAIDLGDMAVWITWHDGPTTRYIEETFMLVRDLRGPSPTATVELTIEDRAGVPERVTAIVRDRWPNGQQGPMVTGYPYAEFTDEQPC